VPQPPAADDDRETLDVRRVLETLDRRGVEYLLVGGMAARFHGATRTTRDVDVVPRSDAENLDRLAAALRDLGAFLRVGGMTDDEAKALPVVLDAEALGRMEISTWRTDAGDLDVLAALRDGDGRRVTFGELVRRSTSTSVGGLTIHLAALDDIIESKRFANREKDQEALPELEQLRVESTE